MTRAIQVSPETGRGGGIIIASGKLPGTRRSALADGEQGNLFVFFVPDNSLGSRVERWLAVDQE